MSRILVIEDDPALLRGLTDNLAAEGHEVACARDGEAGYRLLREGSAELVILDLMLPRLGGYEICRRARSDGLVVPILMLTARGDESDRVFGLDLGADDYMSKPFSVRELMARIRALLRRANPPASLPEQLRLGDVVIDFRTYEAERAGQPVRLTRKEFGVLRFLAAQPGQVVRRDQLLKEVWGYRRFPTTRTVDNHVAWLRAKLEPDPGSPRFLLTVHGIGYKLVPGS